MFLSTRIRHWRRTATLAAAAVAIPAVVALAGPATSASADTIIPCQARTTTQPFKNWGDTRNYFALQGGTFENGASGWNLYGGATTTTAQEPWNIWGGGSRALLVVPRSTAVAPTFCADPTNPFVRFFYKAPADSGAALKVTITIWAGNYTTTIGYVAWGGNTNWQASPAIDIPNGASYYQRSVSVKFETMNSSTAQWLVDDFSVDPWKSL